MTVSRRIEFSDLSDRIVTAVIYLLTFLLLVAVLYPLIFLVSSSFSAPEAVSANKVLLYPVGFSLEAYKLVFQNQDILIGFRNSIVYTAAGTLVNMILTTLLAFPLAQRGLPFRNGIMFFVAFTMFFSGGLIPTYLVVQDLHMIDTVWAMIIPTGISTFNMIIMRTYFQSSIPAEMQEAAYLDGCSNFKFLIMVALPLSAPIIAVLLLYYGVANWNAYFHALIYLRSHSLINLQLVLRNILLANQISTGGNDASGFGERAMVGVTVKYAAIIVSTIPVLVVYPFIQKYFVKGVMIGALKG